MDSKALIDLDDLQFELDLFMFDVNVFYSNLAEVKDTKLKELVIGILHYISISGSDTFCSNCSDVLSVLGDDPHMLLKFFAVNYVGRISFSDGQKRQVCSNRQFLSRVDVSEEDGSKSVRIVFSPLFVAYLTGGVSAVRERLLHEASVA